MACALVVALVGCAGPAPDVAPLTPLLREDGRVVELLNEAEALARGGNTESASRNLRTVVLPRARANWEAAGRVTVVHPRSESARRELVRVTAERVDATERLATLLAQGDPAEVPRVFAQMDRVDRDVDRLEAEVDRLRTAPPPRGCAR